MTLLTLRAVSLFVLLFLSSALTLGQAPATGVTQSVGVTVNIQ
jgi:hypothetical protein